MTRESPLIPVDLMANPIFALSVATSVAAFTAYMLAYVALPFDFETVLGRTPVETGLLMTGWPAALGIAAPLAGWLSDRWPAAILGSIGLLVLARRPRTASRRCRPTSRPAASSGAWLLCGFGFGFFQAPNNRTILSNAPRARAGAAGGMLAISRIVGFTSGATLAAAMFRIAPRHAEAADLSVAAGFALVASAASLMRLRRG